MSNEVAINIKATDNTSSTATAIGKNVESMASKIGAGVVKLGQTVGGEVGELVTRFGEGWEKIQEGGTNTWSKISVGSGVMAGLGIAMQSFASKGQQAEAQLKQAVDNTGASWDDYEEKIAAAEAAGAKYGQTNGQVAQGLQTLVQSTGSTDAALRDLNATYDLAAAKHISFAAAAALIAKIYTGNSKTLKQFGIDMQVTAGNIDEGTAAVDALDSKLSGQADASVDNFNGKISQARAVVTDWAESMAGKLGPVVTYVSTAVSVFSGIIDIISYRNLRASESAHALAVAQAEQGASANAAAASEARLAASTAAAGASATRAAGASGFAGLSSQLGKYGTIGTIMAIGIDANTKALSQATQTAKDHGTAMGVLNGITNVFTGDSQAAGKVISDFLGISHKKTEATKDDTAATQDSIDTTDSQSDAMSRLADSFNAVVPAALSVDDAITKVTGAGESLARTEDTMHLGLNDLKSSLSTSTHTLQGFTTGAINNRSAVEDQIDKINALASAQLKANVPTDQVTAAMKSNELQLLATAKQLGLNTNDTQALIDKYALVPANVATTITASTAAASAALTSYMALLANAESMGLGSTFRSQVPTYQGGGLSATVKEHGGTVGAATGGNRSGVIQWAEHGREMARLPTGSYVMSNPDTETALGQAARAGGGGGFTANFEVASTGNAFDQFMLAWLRNAVRSKGGGNVQTALGSGF